tara:strand:- start:317 stop:2776 length:2460 start_codon:yes stop_codon:yes gene_type:complete
MALRLFYGVFRKGDGNVGVDPSTGAQYLMSYPPPENYEEDPEIPDAPAFAHTGAMEHRHEAGHPEHVPGMGRRIGGEFKQGPYHENVYHGEDDHYYHHGIDGIIHQIGKAMEEAGLITEGEGGIVVTEANKEKLLPRDVVQQAIDEFNRKHSDPRQHLPNVDSVEWRKMHSAVPDKGGAKNWAMYDASNMPTRRPDGRLTTMWTNNKSQDNLLGHFPESYAVPIFRELGEILRSDFGGALSGLASKAEWAKRPWVSSDVLHPYAHRTTGMGGDKLEGDTIGSASISDRVLGQDRFKGIPNLNSDKQVVHSYGLHAHLPKFFYHDLMSEAQRQRGIDSETKQEAAQRAQVFQKLRNHMQMAAQRGSFPDGQVQIGDNMFDISVAMTDPTLRDHIADELSRTISGHFFVGRVQAGGKTNRSPGGRAFDKLLEQFGGDADEEGSRPAHRDMQTHLIAGRNIAGSGTSGQGTHAAARRFYAKVLQSGKGEGGAPSKMAEFEADEEALQQLGISAEGSRADYRRQLASAFGSAVTHAHGFEDLSTLPRYIPTGAHGAHSGGIAGYPTEQMELPPHVADRHAEREIEEPLEDAPPGRQDHTTTEGRPRPVAPSAPEGDKRVRREEPREERGPIQVVPADQMRLDQFTGAPAPVAAPTPMPPQDAYTRLPPEVVAARQFIGQASPQDLRQVISQGNVPIRPGTGPLTPQEQQFQQTMGDPAQRLLTQYLRSLDQSLPEAERLLKAMESMQMDDAKQDNRVMKMSRDPVHLADEYAVQTFAKSVGLTSLDVRAIAHTHGDWQRISDKLGVGLNVIKAVKVTVTGGLS